MQRRLWRAALAASVAMAAGSAAAMSPNEIYAKVSPSVWRVQTYDVDGLPLGFGSGVVIAPDTLVTNCHVLAKAKRVAVKRDKTSVDAKLEMWDPQRDVCQLKAPNLGAPAVALGDVGRLQVGQNVYAIGNPNGLDLTMSAGLLSSIRRNEQGHVFVLQTSAPISGGSSGGGLFDDEGVLIGLTTLRSVGDAQNLNFAVPVDWIKELPQRHARLAKPARAASAAASATMAEAPVSAPPPAAAVPEGAKAAIEDLSRLPYASEKMRERYQVFLTRPLPRAFVISEGGQWQQAWGLKPKDTTLPSSPVDRALQLCEKTNSGRCFVYAVDNHVVYEGPAPTAAAPR